MNRSALNLDNWYALAVINGQEQSICTRLRETIQRHKLGLEVREVVLPVREETVDIGTPNQQTILRNKLPGYVLLRCRRLSPATQIRIAGVKGVMEFMGDGETPSKMPVNEVLRILGKEAGGAGATKGPRFKPGQAVKITEGPMTDFSGEVVELGASTVKVAVEIFGRSTPVDVPFSAVRAV